MHDPFAEKKEENNPAPSTTEEGAPTPSKVAEAPQEKEQPKGFDDTHPEERFNQVKQGDTAELQKLAPQLSKAIIGAGWDLIGFDEAAADLDVSLFLLNKDGVTREDSDFIFYGNEEALDGSIKHTGDSRTGAGSGDDEQILVDFSAVPFDVAKIMVVLTIYDPDNKEYSFQNVRNVYMRVEDQNSDREIFRYLLDEELRQIPDSKGIANGLYIGYFERDANYWIFNALGEITDGGLAKIASQYDLVIAGV